MMNQSRMTNKLYKAFAMMLTLTVVIITPVAQAQYSSCQDYARSAVSQNRENIRLNCGYRGNAWTNDYQGHYNWCARGSLGSANREGQARENRLNDCRRKKGRTPPGGSGRCDAYARSAVAQHSENLRLNCGYRGNAWTKDYQGHYNWCLKASQGSTDYERQSREKRLNDCRRRATPPRRTGDYKSLQSYNYRDHYIRHRNALGEITRIATDLDRKDATFKIVPGLAGGNSISFESLNYPDYYLRHQGYRIKLHKFSNDNLFRQDTSFNIRPGLADRSWSSFESVNYPNYYIRHKNFHLYIERGSGDLYRKDVTFKLVAPLSRVAAPPHQMGQPWQDPAVRNLIDEWLRQIERCARKNHPAAYVDRWGRLCGKVTSGYINCSQSPDHPPGWDSYRYLWNHNWCSVPYSHRLQNYVRRRQAGESPSSLQQCKSGQSVPCYQN